MRRLLTNLASRGLRTDRREGPRHGRDPDVRARRSAAVSGPGPEHLEYLPEAQRPVRRSSRAPTRTATSRRPSVCWSTWRIELTPSEWPRGVREGLDETLTVIGLGLSERLQRSATTNAIESLLSRTRHVQRHVKRWRGAMVLRWRRDARSARRVKGCQDMPALVAALRARDARLGLESRQRWSRSREPSRR